MDSFVEFDDFDDEVHSWLLVGCTSSGWFSSRLASGVKRFEDVQDFFAVPDETIGVFFPLLELCTIGIHLTLVLSCLLDPQGRDGFGRLVASRAVALLMSSRRREIIVFAVFSSSRAH